MIEKDTLKRIALLERELGVLVEDLDGSKLDLRSGLDSLRLEVESLKKFLKQRYPDFSESFGAMKSQTVLENNPEWMSDRP